MYNISRLVAVWLGFVSCSGGAKEVTPDIPIVTLGVVSNIDYEASSDTIKLKWMPVANARSYVIIRDDKEIAEAMTNSFTDASVTPKSIYRYVVYAKNGKSIGEKSTSRTIITKDPEMRHVVDNHEYLNTLTGSWALYKKTGTGYYYDSFTLVFDKRYSYFTRYHIYNHYHYITDTQIESEKFQYVIKNDTIHYKIFSRVEPYAKISSVNETTLKLKYIAREIEGIGGDVTYTKKP